MFFIENIRLALGALFQNKMRSLLTMLGIIIGISAVITITTIGNSMKKTLGSAFAFIGGTGYYVNYQYKDDVEEYIPFRNLRDDEFITNEMTERLVEEFHGKYLVSRDRSFGSGKIENSKGQHIAAVINGVTEGFFTANAQFYRVLDGRCISEQDSKRQKNAIVVSDLFVKQYFQNGEDPLNQKICIEIEGQCTVDFTIVGIYKHPPTLDKMLQPDTALMDRMSIMFIPYGTALHLSSETSSEDRYPDIVTPDTSVPSDEAIAELQAFFDREFANNRMIYPVVKSSSEDLKIINIVLTIVTLTISIIAAISLLVGGIGVMNIMLVSITERTREIGIRKAIGAKSSTIRVQFIIEAIILCLIGGIIGIGLGLINGIVIGAVGNYVFQTMYSEYADLIQITVQPSLLAIFISLGFSMLIGVFFGSYPASRAAKLDPIEALRYE
jgi:putative ABC transport system permease protein